MRRLPSLGRTSRCLLLSLIFIPLFHLAWLSVWRGDGFTLSAYSAALEPGTWPLLLRTTRLAAGATALALLLGGAAASQFEMRRFPFQGALRIASLAPLLVPPVLQVAVWERLSRPGGPLLSIFLFAAEAGKPFPLRNEPFAIFLLGLSYSPIIFFFAGEGIRSISRDLLEAAALSRRPAAVWLRVLAPLAMPSAAAGAGIVFTLSFLNYEVPRLLDVTTYPVLINVNYGSLDDPGMAFAAAAPGLLLAGALLLSLEAWAGR